MSAAKPTAKRMPNFCQPTRGVRQTMQSALKSLRALGVEDQRIQIRRVGGGWPRKRGEISGTENGGSTDARLQNAPRNSSQPGAPNSPLEVVREGRSDRAVVEQYPKAGTVLSPNQGVILTVSAPSAVNALPFAMRDVVEGGLGTDRFMPILDTPIAKLEAFVEDAGGFFELRPERPETGWRWIREIFQLEPGELPDNFVYRLARFLPALYRVAGTERGVELGLHALFDLPLKRLELRAMLVPMVSERHMRLGVKNGRLGVDAVIGDGVTARAHAIVTIGPVTLAEYLEHDTSAARRHRELLYQLVMPTIVRLPVQESWYVLPPAAGLVLGSSTEPVRLGLNTRFTTVTTQG